MEVSANWLRELDTALLVPCRWRASERASNRRMRALCLAAWIAVRGDLCTSRVADMLDTFSSGEKLIAAKEVGRQAVHQPAGLVTLVHYLMGPPAQSRDRIPLGCVNMAVHLATPYRGSERGWERERDMEHEWALPPPRMLTPAIRQYDTDMHCHVLSDLLTAFSDFMSTAAEGPASHAMLDCLGGLLHLCHTTAAHYSNAWETFPEDLKADHDTFHVPIIAVWNMLLKRCRADGRDTLARSTLACYALLRPAATVRIKSDVERALARQVEALVLFSILGTLFPQIAVEEEAASAAAASEDLADEDDAGAGQYMPAWFFQMGSYLTPEMRVYVHGVSSRWGGWAGTATSIDKQSSFCRLVMETQCQLPLLVLRRGKCCYSNRFVFALK